MLKRSGIFLLALSFLLCCTVAEGRPRTYSYTLLSPNDGYPLHVTSIFIDESGSSHIGSTSGLFRIRSNSFTKSSAAAEMPFKIPSDHVYQVLRDKSDAFWALTGKGVIGFSPRSGDKPYQRMDSPEDSIVAYSALAMDDCIYFGGENAIWKSDYKDRNRKRLATVMTQEKRIQTLLESTMTVNRFKSRTARMNVKPVKINMWIQETAQVYMDEAESKGIDIEFNLDPAAGVVSFDPVSCGVVFDNIIQNALSHNAAGEPILISSIDLQGEGFVRVSVADNGPGIAEDDPSALFERYYKVTEEKTGFGVGLSYAKHIIDIHEGRIGAGNNPDGKGACFWFDLPVDR